MVDVNGLNETINDFKDTVSALSEIRVISENIQKIRDDVVAANGQAKNSSHKLIETSEEIKGFSRNMIASNDILTSSIREYNVSVQKSVDEIRQREINSSREIREKVDGGVSDIKSQLTTINNELSLKVNSLEKNIAQCEMYIEDTKHQIKKQKSLIITCIVASAATVVISIIGLLM